MSDCLTYPLLMAGARAVGILSVLFDGGYIPDHHMKAALDILDEWERNSPKNQKVAEACAND